MAESRRADDRPAPAAAIGALAANFGVIEASKIARGAWDETLTGRELYLDAANHTYYVTDYARQPDCRFDHDHLEVESLGDVTLAEALALALPAGEPDPAAELSLGEDVFAGCIRCNHCGRKRAIWKPLTRVSPEEQSCPACGRRHFFAGVELQDVLTAASTPSELRSRSLSELGIAVGDIITIRAQGSVRHFEIAEKSQDPPAEKPGVSRGVRVALFGCGNIGSHAIPLIPRIPGLEGVLLVDPDSYEARNLPGHDIRRSDLGRAKVSVQAERLRAIAPGLAVETVAAPLESLPLGRLRNHILLGALDSLRARQSLNTIAFRIGEPWIDLAVGIEGLVCRATVYRPGPESACIECRWGDGDYARIEDRYSCIDHSHDAHDAASQETRGRNETTPITAQIEWIVSQQRDS